MEMLEPIAITPLGLDTQREVDALFSEAKHFAADNVHTAKLPTGVDIEYAVHTARVDNATEEEERVLLLMGFMEGKESWAPLIDLIHEKWTNKGDKKKNLTIVSFDNRGCGNSTAQWGYNSTSLMATDALALMDHLGWTKANIIGLSMGGMIALELATSAPQRLTSLSLIVTTRGKFDSAGATNFILKTMTNRGLEAQLQMTIDFFYPKEFLSKKIKGSDETAFNVLHRLHKQKMTNMKPHSVGGYVGQTLAIRTHYVSDERLSALGKAGIPISIIGCANDQLIPAVEAVKLWNIIGTDRARLVYYNNAAHCVPYQCPDEVSQVLFENIESAM